MVGNRISHYKVLEKLGQGGMGVVYKADDTRLERRVALKFLPEHLLGDEEVRKRFVREAKAAAALDHANICTVHEIDESDGKTFIAMSLIEGEPLDKRIGRGPLKIDEALDIAQQIAAGLEAAHKKGVVHRDIKPENIMVGPDSIGAGGRVTIMDFGLAQLTQASRLTRADQTMGTVAYMSPEQTEGSGTDQRTDVWSLGVVLYEMITGRQPFQGDYAKAVMYSILNEEPEPMTALRTGVPMELEVAAGKCMAKAVEDRYGSAGEVGRDLRLVADKLKETPSQSVVVKAAGENVKETPRWSYLWTAIGAALLGALIVWRLLGPHAPDHPTVTRLHLNLPGLDPQPGLGWGFTISPDGRTIAFVANGMINLRELESLDTAPILGTEDGYTPFFSPDGEWLGFLTVTGVRKVSLRGGPPITLATVGNPGRAVWCPNGEIIFDTRGPSGLKRVSAAGGGSLEDFTTTAEDEIDHAVPQILPDGDTVIFGVLPEGKGWTEASIFAKSLTNGKPKLLVEAGGGSARYVDSGHLIYKKGGALMAAPFDAARLQITGESVPVAEGVSNLGAANTLTYSRNGTLVYLASSLAGAPPRALVWVDRQGREEAVGLGPDSYSTPRISPDGSKLAITAQRPRLGRDVMLYDLERRVLERTLAQFEGNDNAPVWSANGDRVFYISDESGGKVISKSSDGTQEETLVKSWIAPQSASPDGSILVYLELNGEGGRDIGTISLDGDRTPRILLGGKSLEDSPDISPDGRFLAYSSTESDKSEIYVSPFPNVDRGRSRISYNGGAYPAWSSSGDELFYLNGRTMMAARRTPGSTATWSEPIALFTGDYLTSEPFARPFDVAPDGRFLMVKLASGSRPEELTVVLNWFEELERLVPTN